MARNDENKKTKTYFFFGESWSQQTVAVHWLSRELALDHVQTTIYSYSVDVFRNLFKETIPILSSVGLKSIFPLSICHKTFITIWLWIEVFDKM